MLRVAGLTLLESASLLCVDAQVKYIFHVVIWKAWKITYNECECVGGCVDGCECVGGCVDECECVVGCVDECWRVRG